VVFSQFYECLTWAKGALHQVPDLRVLHVERSMPLARRMKVLSAWQGASDQGVSLLLVTAKSALAGVDLTGATCCYLLEPCLSRHLETLLIGRVREATAASGGCRMKRLVAHGTVEERIASLRHEGAHGGALQAMKSLFPPPRPQQEA